MNGEQKMTWAIIVPLILQYGLPFAEKVWLLWAAGNLPTQADWDTLKELAKLRAVDLMRQVLAKLNIDPESEQGKALIMAATVV